MGAPIKHRKKFVSHKKRWDKNTIEEEAVIMEDYSLKNKREIRKVELKISKLKSIAKSLNKNEQTKNSQEAKNFAESLKAKGFLNVEATSLDEVLDISVRDILDRRLSNILYKNKLARTPSQARQFIVHRHVKVNGKLVDSPSFSVSLIGEENLEFKGNSSLANEEHPERVLATGGVIEEEIVEEAEEAKNTKSTFDEKDDKVKATETKEAVEAKN